MWVVEGPGGGVGQSAAGGGILILQQQAGRGQAEHDANNCPLCLVVHLLHFQLWAINSNSRAEREKR